jgi:plastocyanin
MFLSRKVCTETKEDIVHYRGHTMQIRTVSLLMSLLLIASTSASVLAEENDTTQPTTGADNTDNNATNETTNETNAVTCDATIGISPGGYKYSPSSVSIEIGETVCWSWTNETMEHNVKEVDGDKSTTFVEGGITSGEPNLTVDFHHTFTDNTTFYYACEPHISLEMFGKVVVGDGGVEPMEAKDDMKKNETPGFLGVTLVLAALGALLFIRNNRPEEL